MALDWFAFLRQHNIPYTTTGPNASRGRVNVKCPFCSDDPSEHMGISISGRGWSCWRNAGHKGRSTPRLIAALLRCTLQEAERLSGGEVALPSDGNLMSELQHLMGSEFEDTPVRSQGLSFPKEFKSLNNGSPFANQFRNYLSDRGYRKSTLDWLIEAYDLRYAISGRFAHRIIIPIYDRWRELQTWTGRTIKPDEEIRYKTLRHEEQLCSPKQTLLGLPLLWNAPNPKALLICEGPFDAFWVTAFGRTFGVYATCLFGLTMSPQQAELLLELGSKFPQQALLLDSEASFQAFRLSSSGLNLRTIALPSDVKDPAELSAGAVADLCLSLV